MSTMPEVAWSGRFDYVEEKWTGYMSLALCLTLLVLLIVGVYVWRLDTMEMPDECHFKDMPRASTDLSLRQREIWNCWRNRLTFDNA